MSEAASLLNAPVASAGSATLQVSIVIISFNTRDLLRDCLASTLQECGALASEILVVDNASADGSPEMVEREFPGVRLIRSATNLGFGAANNLALQQARGRYFVLLNSDAFLAPGALHRALRHMDETPACALGGGRLVGRDGVLQPSAMAFHSLLGDFLVLTGLSGKFPRLFGHALRGGTNNDQAAQVDWVPGAFAIVRPAALEKIGLFDPSFFLYYEEVDLCLRMKQASMEVWYWPDVVVTHLGGESSKQLSNLEFSPRAAQVVLWRMRSTLLYYRKHHGSQAWFAKWMEKTLYSLTVLRNRLSRTPERRERERHYRAMLALLDQAWHETQGGRVSPPRPW